MVADIQLLQGKIIDDPEKRVENISHLLEELTREFLTIQSDEQDTEVRHERTG